MTTKGGGGTKTKKTKTPGKNRIAKRSKAQPFPARHAGTSSDNPNRALPQGKRAGFHRTKSKINILNMYRSKPDLEKMKERPLEPARIQPDRRWFGNVRVITQSKLEQFREAAAACEKNPYLVKLKASKLPVSLFNAETQGKKGSAGKNNLLQVEPFDRVFGKHKQRKRPRLMAECVEGLMNKADESTYDEEKDQSLVDNEVVDRVAVSEEVFKKGTSRRIWQELYKVLDSSDIVVQVLDARDPLGTRCQQLENYIRKHKTSKHIILLLNKCDLIPTWAASKWVKILSSEFPTVAFKSSISKPFGRLVLINLLRQFASLMKNRKHVSVGFVGYPNVGKSSIINTLRKKKVCKAAPIPGETKVWQYIALTNRVYLIDCPGIVPGEEEAGDETTKVLKGVVRAEKIAAPEEHISPVLENTERSDLLRVYGLAEDATWDSPESFLTLVAMRRGRLLKSGEPDISSAARIVLYDWQRGRIPYFVAPKKRPRAESGAAAAVGGDEGNFPPEVVQHA